MKKKLTELANDVLKHLPWGQVSSHTAEELADYFIANGVTFADVPDANVGKWIPAGEPPEKDGRYFVAERTSFFSKPPEYYRGIATFACNLEEVDEYDFRGRRRAGWYDYDSEYGHYELERVAYWMPLPKLPGEE